MRSRIALMGFTMCYALAITRDAHAQGTVRVLDRDSVPIPFAMVSVEGATARATDSTGRVRLAADPGQSPRVTVRRIGYSPFDGAVHRTPSGEHVVVVDHAQRQLETVRTVAPRATAVSRTGFYDRMERVERGAIVGWFISPEDLEARAISQVSRAVEGVGSIRVSRASGGKAIITGRGGCNMIILLDGQRLNKVLGQGASQGAPLSISVESRRAASSRPSSPQPVLGDPSIDELVEGNSVMAIEIYPSLANAPSELIPLTGGGGCGIIALWTGPRR